MSSTVVLDTSAWFALAEREPGAQDVEAYLEEAWDGQVLVHASFVTLTELEYIRAIKHGAVAAAKLISWAKEQPVQWHHSEEAICSTAAKLKATHKLSFADSFVAGLAQRLNATLVHKDPEFSAIGDAVKQRILPPKTNPSAAGTK